MLTHKPRAGSPGQRVSTGHKPSICASCTWRNLSPTPWIMRTFQKAWNLTSVFSLNGSPANACPENLTTCKDESLKRSHHEICVQTMQEEKSGSRKRGNVHSTLQRVRMRISLVVLLVKTTATLNPGNNLNTHEWLFSC